MIKRIRNQTGLFSLAQEFISCWPLHRVSPSSLAACSTPRTHPLESVLAPRAPNTHSISSDIYFKGPDAIFYVH